MATLFTTLLTTLGSAGSAAGGAAAVGGAAATAGSAFSFLSVASTVVGGLSSIIAGKQQADALNQQAVDEETKAVQETINGKQDALNSLRELNKDQAAIAVAGYASGIGGEGSVEAAQEEALKIGENNINMSRDNARFRSASRRSQATQLRKSASGAITGGIFGAIQGGLSLGSRRLARG